MNIFQQILSTFSKNQLTKFYDRSITIFYKNSSIRIFNIFVTDDSAEVSGSTNPHTQNRPIQSGHDIQGCANKPFKPRKRQRKESQRALAKRLRNSGQSYINVKGNVVPGKMFNNDDCGCPKKCLELITEDERRQQYEIFIKMCDFGKQNAYLCGLIHQAPIQQRRPRDGSKGSKKSTNLYYVHKGDNTVRVCKQYFLKTFLVSDGRVTRAINKIRSGYSPGDDLRGKHVAAQKISPEQKEHVRNHINMFPAFQSHYSRKDNPNRKYLDPDLNMRQMYNLYEEFCTGKQLDPVKEHAYRYIFNNEFNLQFHHPRKDTCKNCDKYRQMINVENNTEKKAALEREHTLHLAKAERARDSLKADGVLAKENPDTYTITEDLQKALPFPKLTVSEAYYRRKMYCYNLGVHDVAKKLGYMYVWDETTASRGSQEISSCLVKHIKQNLHKHVIIYSDTCTGQNRNIKVSLSLLKLTQETSVEIIDQKFMVSGHSYLPNDSDFGLIEQAARNKIIYTPDDWYSVIRTSRKQNKFMLIKMHEEDFLSVDALEKAVTRRKKDITNTAVQWLRYEKNKPYSILYKYTLNEDFPFSEINVKPRKAGRPLDLGSIIQEKLYNGPRVINYLKKRDMLYLLKYIPPIHHNFFKSIRSSQDVEDMGPLTPGEVEEEES